MGAHTTPGARLSWLTPQVRQWLYGVAMVVLPILVAYGVLDDARAPLWAALVGGILVPGVALAHVDTSTTSGAPRTEEITREVNARQLP